MAAAEVVRWSLVVGEYGVLLTEMGSTEDLVTPIKPYPRIKVGAAIKFSINTQPKMSSIVGRLHRSKFRYRF